MTVADMLRQHARMRPHKPAIVERGRSIDYATLDRIVDGVCGQLAQRGVSRGVLVGVSLGDDAGHVAVLIALGRVGAVLLPLDRRWTVGEAEGVAGRFGARCILTDRDDVPAWVKVERHWFTPSDAPYADPAVDDDCPMVLSLSSGTTGQPKGPLLTHRQFLSRFMVYWIDIGLGSRDRFLVPTPLYFGGGRAFAIAMIFAGGTTCLLAPPYRPEELVAFAAETGATAMFLVPTLIRRLLDHGGDAPAFPSVRILISSGSPLYAAEARQARARLTPGLFQHYSSTEGGGVTLLAPEDHDANAGSVGRPCFGVSVEVVGDGHQPLPAGAVGRLRYRSPASPDRYHMGDGTDAFRDGWFYPGDLASFDADGFLYLRGRAKDVIIRGGVNIYPADIEQVLLDRDDVADAAVLGYPSPELGEEIAAFVVRRGDVDEAALRAACAEKLARYKVPGRFIFRDELPKNAGGKTVKAELAKLLPALQGDGP